MPNTGLALARRVDSIIHLLRGERVIFDSDLAELYGVSVKHLNQQIKRNARRFPPDFLFQLSPAEYENLRSQIVDLKFRPWRPPLFAAGFYRTWRCYGGQRFEFCTSHQDEYLCGSRIRAHARNVRRQSTATRQALRT